VLINSLLMRDTHQQTVTDPDPSLFSTSYNIIIGATATSKQVCILCWVSECLVCKRNTRFARKVVARHCCPFGHSLLVAPFSHVVFGAEGPTGPLIDYNRTLESNASSPSPSTVLHYFVQAPHAAGSSTCCSSSCEGQECVSTRAQLRKLATNSSLLELSVKAVTQKEHHPSDRVSCPLCKGRWLHCQRDYTLFSTCMVLIQS
jgi:hypothetical protein